jgi:CRP-like cAMP-binding protein
LREENAMAALLASLLPGEYQHLLPDLEKVHLPAKRVLYAPGDRITDVYFPVDCVISLLIVLADGVAVETGLVGREGVTGLPLFLGETAGQQRAVCQIPGHAWRLPAARFLASAGGSGRMPPLLRRYTQALLLQTAQGMACSRRHSVEAQCARWLLMCRDRTGTDQLALSHAYLAQMLGVRRATVTVVLGGFQAAGLLTYHRGLIGILDGPALTAVACECYSVLAATFAVLLGPLEPLPAFGETTDAPLLGHQPPPAS